MDLKKIKLQSGILIGLIFLAAMSRLLPHPPNFTPIGGMALFGAAWFSRRSLAFFVPLAALWFSNLLLDNVLYSQYYEGFQWFSNPMVFVSFALISLLGFVNLKKLSLGRLFGSSLLASLIFFLVSNFGSWLEYGLYPKTWEGLVACYAAGLPFFLNTVAGDLFYVAFLFGSFAYIRKNYLQPKIA